MDDQTAHAFLKSRGYTLDDGFVYHPPTKDHKVTAQEGAALDYLWLEWDYGYSPEPQELKGIVNE